MNPIEFLRAVLPSDGYYAWVRIKNKRVKQKLTADIADIKKIVPVALKNEEDIYFGCSSFEEPTSRAKSNVKFIKSFWIDLDCGAGTAYPTKDDGLAALFDFCKGTKLPKPWIVDSGRGLHVYWTIGTPILVHVWQIYADNLMRLCEAQGLKIKDPGCSIDSARILRVPNTYNFKNPDDPLLVGILVEGTTVPWDSLKTRIETACGLVNINGFHEAPAKAPKFEMDEATRALMGDTLGDFKKIARLSLDGKGCAVIQHAILNQEDTPEPMWKGVISIIKSCDDAEQCAQRISKGHPDYTPEETSKKLAQATVPWNCDSFRKHGCGAYCDSCPSKGKVTNPISLSRTILESKNPIIVEHDPNLGITTADILPDLSWPYFRGEGGGIYRRGEQGPDGEEGKPITIYKYDLNVMKRVIDPERGETLVLLHKRPKDGTSELQIPLADVQASDRLKDHLGKAGVAAYGQQMTNIAKYIVDVTSDLQKNKQAEAAYTQMGWTEDRQGFVWGRKLFKRDGGVLYCPPSTRSTTVAEMMKTRGSFQTWEEIIQRYAAPGMELQAMCIFIAFGSLLHKYTLEDPAWIHMVSGASGTGKTTLTMALNSMWGDSDSLMLRVDDTINAFNKRRLVFNSIAICQDEITNKDAKDISTIAYSQSQQREKMRLTSQSVEMVNRDRWNNTMFSNGNRDIGDMLASFRSNADGELARLIQIPFKQIDPNHITSSADHYGLLRQNYGHGGPEFARWLVMHEEELSQRVSAVKDKFHRDIRSISKERNWVATTSVGFSAVEVLQKELKILTKFDVPRIYDVWGNHIVSTRKSTGNLIVSHSDLLGDFINENHGNLIIPDATAAKAMGATSNIIGHKPERDTRIKVAMRYEKTISRLYISKHELKAYCERRKHSFNELILFFTQQKYCTGFVNKRLGAGAGAVSAPTQCLEFHTDKGLMSDLMTDAAT